MNRDEFVRLRTDALVAFHTKVDFDPSDFLKAVEAFYADGRAIEKEDAMLMSMFPAMEQGPYRMQDLDKPSIVSNLNLPVGGYDDYLAGQRRFSTNYAEDWPQAHEENPFGKRHPLSWDNATMPLLQGSQWGEPHFIEHLLALINEDEDGHMLLNTMQEMERRGIVPREMEELLGRPSESLLDLYMTDRDRHNFLSDEEYRERKMREWGASIEKDDGIVKNLSRLGLLSYLFGLEWQTPEQRMAFMDILKEMGGTEGADSPEARRLMNTMKAGAGLSWDRAKRNWFERTLPLARWWERPSDRHGPVSPDPTEGLHHFKSPYVRDEASILPSHTHHWWEPYQWWGGVGRDANSLRQMMTDSYPSAFRGWLGDELMSFMVSREHPLSDAEDSYHGSGSSFFPQTANHPDMQAHPHRPAIATGWEAGSEHPRVRSFNRRRGLWSTISHGQHLHPSEVIGNEGRMIVPSMALTQQPLGRIVSAHADMGTPRIGPTRERHPGDEAYHDYHNAHFSQMDGHLGTVMQEMARSIMERYGADVFNTSPSNLMANTINRGNMQQLAQAANYQLMRGNNPNTTTFAPMMMGGGIGTRQANIGPIHPDSEATAPPVYLSGDMDAWGHEMPATLAWKWDKDANGIRFDVKKQPFTAIQKTVHGGHLAAVDPTHGERPIAPKERDAPAMFVTNEMGHPPIISGDIWKSDDYEANGVFETAIAPAHTIYKIDDLKELRGFSGHWVVQKKPAGRRVIVDRRGSKVTAKNAKGKEVKLPDVVKEAVREQMGDCTFDATLEGKHLRAFDLLVHKGDDIHMEPLEDRLQILRTMYSTNDALSFPMPLDTKFTDDDGLKNAASSIDGDLWIRDAKSTFAKGKEAHHLWTLYTPNDESGISKGTTLPFVVNRGTHVALEYPGHNVPLLVKGEWDGVGLDIVSIEPEGPLSRHAWKQAWVWGPVAVNLIEKGMAEASPYPPLLQTSDSFLFSRAALLEPDGDEDPVAVALRRAKRLIAVGDKTMTTEQLTEKVKGLTSEMLERYAEEYGLEEAKNGQWTVNEAIDDDTVETKASTTLAAISGSMTGGGWEGLMDMLTAPRGPTTLTDDEGIPMFDPSELNTGEMPEMPDHVRISMKDGVGEEVEGELEVESGRATLRFPRKTRAEMKDENEVVVEQDPDESPELPING